MIYEKLAAYYDQFIDEELYLEYVKLINKYYSEGNLLDLGCGTAQLAIKLAENGFFVTATDISDSMLEIAYNNAFDLKGDIKFFIHNILDPINSNYDVITMSSDVINYLENETQIMKAFKNISNIMDENSIFVFDFLREKYIESIIGHHEEIKLDNTSLIWNVEKTDVALQIKHTVTIDGVSETHIQTTYPEKRYKQLLNLNNLKIIKKRILNERIIFVCKKD